MNREDQIESIKKLVEPMLKDDIFLVEIKIKPTNNIKIYLDADSGLGIEKCIKINRALYKIMEEMGIYPDGDYSLEVSSPGTEEPFKLHRQYVKNIGREVELTLNEEIKTTGKLIAVTDDVLTLEISQGKGKKETVEQVDFLLSDIKQTKVVIKF
ncbi:MAG: ribosome maturation factor [Ferruginibacter sp.]